MICKRLYLRNRPIDRQWTCFASQMIEIEIILSTNFSWKSDGIIIFVKNLFFSHKIEHKNITDPSHDVTDEYSIGGKVLQQLWIP